MNHVKAPVLPGDIMSYDLWAKVYGYLEPEDRVRLLRVCKAWLVSAPLFCRLDRTTLRYRGKGSLRQALYTVLGRCQPLNAIIRRIDIIADDREDDDEEDGDDEDYYCREDEELELFRIISRRKYVTEVYYRRDDVVRKDLVDVFRLFPNIRKFELPIRYFLQDEEDHTDDMTDSYNEYRKLSSIRAFSDRNLEELVIRNTSTENVLPAYLDIQGSAPRLEEEINAVLSRQHGLRSLDVYSLGCALSLRSGTVKRVRCAAMALDIISTSELRLGFPNLEEVHLCGICLMDTFAVVNNIDDAGWIAWLTTSLKRQRAAIETGFRTGFLKLASDFMLTGHMLQVDEDDGYGSHIPNIITVDGNEKNPFSYILESLFHYGVDPSGVTCLRLRSLRVTRDLADLLARSFVSVSRLYVDMNFTDADRNPLWTRGCVFDNDGYSTAAPLAIQVVIDTLSHIASNMPRLSELVLVDVSDPYDRDYLLAHMPLRTGVRLRME